MQSVLHTFLPAGTFQSISCTPVENGYINKTYHIRAVSKQQQQQFILQRINTHVFPNPEAIIHNMLHIALHLGVSPYSKNILKPLQNTNGNFLTYDSENFPWRLLPFIVQSKTLNTIPNTDQAYAAAATFSEFYQYLNTMDPGVIQVAIPGFLDFQKRVNDFYIARDKAKPHLKKQAADILNYLSDHEQLPGQYIAMQRQQQLPQRIIHADPKLSNILFHIDASQTLAVIDLDTVMPGSLLYDYGDMIRSFTNRKAEDDPDGKNCFDAEVFHAVTEGFLFHTQSFLNPTELGNLSYAAQVVAYIQALRFITDFLNENMYYKVTYPTQNLNRAINQVNLLKALMRQ